MVCVHLRRHVESTTWSTTGSQPQRRDDQASDRPVCFRRSVRRLIAWVAPCVVGRRLGHCDQHHVAFCSTPAAAAAAVAESSAAPRVPLGKSGGADQHTVCMVVDNLRSGRREARPGAVLVELSAVEHRRRGVALHGGKRRRRRQQRGRLLSRVALLLLSSGIGAHVGPGGRAARGHGCKQARRHFAAMLSLECTAKQIGRSRQMRRSRSANRNRQHKFAPALLPALFASGR